jgi:hypothetical protein
MSRTKWGVAVIQCCGREVKVEGKNGITEHGIELRG